MSVALLLTGIGFFVLTRAALRGIDEPAPRAEPQPWDLSPCSVEARSPGEDDGT